MAREEEGFFDDLARGLADGSITRGRALRLMGAALVGGTLGSLGIGEAAADRPGCKRLGKNCTRTDQCCGSLVCVSGTCQTPPTTTTSTTSTSTSTTSTSTSTTSTTTTTCSGLPNGATCTANDQCCSGTCSLGTNTCRPPGTGPNHLICHCPDGDIETCSSVNCGSRADLQAACMTCGSGPVLADCFPNSTLCSG